VNNEIKFRAITGEELIVEEFTGDAYAHELTTTNRVELDGVTFRMCFKNAYADFPSAKVCYTGDGEDKSVTISEAKVITIHEDIGEEQKLFLETNQLTGEEKVVTIRKVIELLQGETYRNDDWYGFAADVVEGMYPVFEIEEDTFYIPFADSTTLWDFALSEYPYGLPRFAQVERITDISYRGTIVLDDKLILIEQSETDDELKPVSVTFEYSNNAYLPLYAEKLTLEGSDTEINFVTIANGNTYKLKISSVSNLLVRLQLERLDSDGNDILMDKYLAVGDVKIIRLDGIATEIRVEEINPDENEAVISIKRK
jgi:hypothetical protein